MEIEFSVFRIRSLTGKGFVCEFKRDLSVIELVVLWVQRIQYDENHTATFFELNY